MKESNRDILLKYLAKHGQILACEALKELGLKTMSQFYNAMSQVRKSGHLVENQPYITDGQVTTCYKLIDQEAVKAKYGTDDDKLTYEQRRNLLIPEAETIAKHNIYNGSEKSFGHEFSLAMDRLGFERLGARMSYMV